MPKQRERIARERRPKLIKKKKTRQHNTVKFSWRKKKLSHLKTKGKVKAISLDIKQIGVVPSLLLANIAAATFFSATKKTTTLRIIAELFSLSPRKRNSPSGVIYP